MITRRDFLGISVGAGAFALSPAFLRILNQQSGTLIQRAIPSSGEALPVIGLSFSNHPGCADRAALKDVVKAFTDGGGRVYDALHVNPDSEQFHITAAKELGVQNKLFWSTRATPAGAAPQPGATFVNNHIDSLLTRIGVPKIDLAMLPVAADVTHIAALKDEKKAGRVRYIGVQTISVSAQTAQLESIMRNEPIDFIGVDYAINNRFVEQKILPLAQERKIGVIAFFPLGNAGGLSCQGGTSLFSRVGARPLPEWAAEFDAKTWAQFFLKYVISHPAITVARPGTTKADHMLDNISGGIGRLPDEATRKRMAELVEALPAAAPLAPQGQQQFPAPLALSATLLDRYVGDYKDASGTILNFRRYGTTLVVKVGSNPDSVLFARSETLFSLGTNSIEFQSDSAGTVTGLMFEGGNKRIPASRVR